MFAIWIVADNSNGRAFEQVDLQSSTGRTFEELSAPRALQFISFDPPRAYPGILYYTRMAVIGGTWPYQFQFLKAPQGSVITSDRGEVAWTPEEKEKSGSFSVQVTDSLGKKLVKEWAVTVTTDGFSFVAKNGDNAGGDGSIQKPWLTIQHAINRIKGVGTIYVRAGIYRETARDGQKADFAYDASSYYHDVILMVGQSRSFGHQQATRENPFILSSYPGESAVIDGDGEQGPICLWTPYALVEGIEVKKTNRRSIWATQYSVIRGCRLGDVSGESDNCQAIWTAAGNCPELVVQDCKIHDIHQPKERSHAGGVCLYGVTNGLLEDNEIRNTDNGGLGDKDNGRGNEYRGNVMQEIPGAGLALLGQGGNEDCWIHDNLLIGGSGMIIGLQYGTSKKDGVFRIRVHHNTIVATNSQIEAAFNTRFDRDTAAWNNVIQSKGAAIWVHMYKGEGFHARRMIFDAPKPIAFKCASDYHAPWVDLSSFTKSTDSDDLISEKVHFMDPDAKNYRLKLTPALEKLAGANDYLGAHKRVLDWATRGCPMRNRDTVAQRLAPQAVNE